MAVLHEHLGYAVGDALGLKGLWHEYAWVLPYGIAVLVLGALYLRFLLSLPADTRALMLIGGCCYVLGAIGIELLGSSFWELGSSELSAQYYLFASLEESLEMTGIVIFIYSLLIYISDQQLTLSCIRHSNNRN